MITPRQWIQRPLTIDDLITGTNDCGRVPDPLAVVSASREAIVLLSTARTTAAQEKVKRAWTTSRSERRLKSRSELRTIAGGNVPSTRVRSAEMPER
jgi:hypothetical protein